MKTSSMLLDPFMASLQQLLQPNDIPGTAPRTALSPVETFERTSFKLLAYKGTTGAKKCGKKEHRNIGNQWNSSGTIQETKFKPMRSP